MLTTLCAAVANNNNFTMARRRALAVVVAGANALQCPQPPRQSTVRFSDAAPEAEAVEAAPVETQMVAAPVETPEERAARDADG